MHTGLTIYYNHHITGIILYPNHPNFRKYIILFASLLLHCRDYCRDDIVFLSSLLQGLLLLHSCYINYIIFLSSLLQGWYCILVIVIAGITYILSSILQGLHYIHTSFLKSHGHLTSDNCLVTNRWMVKISSCGMQSLRKVKESQDGVDEYQLNRGKSYGRIPTKPR